MSDNRLSVCGFSQEKSIDHFRPQGDVGGTTSLALLARTSICRCDVVPGEYMHRWQRQATAELHAKAELPELVIGQYKPRSKAGFISFIEARG